MIHGPDRIAIVVWVIATPSRCAYSEENAFAAQNRIRAQQPIEISMN